LVSEDRRAIFQQAWRLASSGRFDEADALVRKSVPKPARDAEGLRIRGQLAMVAHRPGEAKSLLEKSLRVQPTVAAHLQLAQYHLNMVENDAAVAACRAAISLDPRNAAARIQTAAMFVELGRIDDADEALAPALSDRDVDSATARRAAITLASIEIQRRELDAAIARLRDVLADDPPPVERRGALDLLTKALDRAGRHDDAFAAATARHAMDPPSPSPESILAEADRLIAANGRTALERLPLGPRDERPVFIAGMPRSGTSLVDRIIDAHPLAAGVGERPVLERAAATVASTRSSGLDDANWTRLATRTLADLASPVPAGVTRIVDKSLANDRLLGLAWRLLPGARVLHVVRDPRDVAVSCHLGQFNLAKHPWTVSLAGTAAAWEASRRLMAHWRTTIDLPILEVRYERLVRDPDTEFPRIIEFLGLDWDESCRRFHESGRPLRTLSFDQVSRPLYATSVGRHASYASHLGDVNWPSYDPNA
jgi:tetratricopeptide (TPR) repeat protein